MNVHNLELTSLLYFPLESSEYSTGTKLYLGVFWKLERVIPDPRQTQLPDCSSQETMAFVSAPWTILTPHQTGPIVLPVNKFQEESWTNPLPGLLWPHAFLNVSWVLYNCHQQTLSQTNPVWPQDFPPTAWICLAGIMYSFRNILTVDKCLQQLEKLEMAGRGQAVCSPFPV